MIFFSLLKRYDWLLLGSVFFLISASLLSLLSSNPQFFYRQLLWFAVALILIFGGSVVHWRWLIAQGWFRYGLYILSLMLLLVTNLQSHTVRGTKSWLFIGGFQFEPSELVKLSIIFLLAGFFSRRYIQAWLGKNIFTSFGLTILPVALILIQPDFGSASVIMMIWVGFVVLSGVNVKRFVLALCVGIIAAVIAWSFLFKPYQKARLTGFIFPTADPLGVNYNVIQSKIAIGSAGLFGKGFGAGTQVHLKFLPEAQTDFLFAAFVEEWGIIGGALLILAFLILLSRMISIGLKTSGNDMKFVVLGGCVVMMVHFIINIGSNLGFLPVAGVPFPFLSYGGSSLLTLGALMGIVEHIQLESR